MGIETKIKSLGVPQTKILEFSFSTGGHFEKWSKRAVSPSYFSGNIANIIPGMKMIPLMDDHGGGGGAWGPPLAYGLQYIQHLFLIFHTCSVHWLFCVSTIIRIVISVTFWHCHPFISRHFHGTTNFPSTTCDVSIIAIVIILHQCFLTKSLVRSDNGVNKKSPHNWMIEYVAQWWTINISYWYSSFVAAIQMAIPIIRAITVAEVLQVVF